MARRLKVFQAQFGFYDSVVAAPSQAAALRAWGAHQNLFSDGGARLATDEQAIEAALAEPEVPLRRAIGSNDPFSLTPRLPRLPDLPGLELRPSTKTVAKPARSPKTGPKVPTPAPKPLPPDRSRLDAAEAALDKLKADRRREEAELRTRQDSLDAEKAAAERRYAEARQQAEQALKREQQAFIRASGRR